MTTLATNEERNRLVEHAVIEGDLSNLTPEQRLAYYSKVCESLGLNPYTKPFAYLKLSHREQQDGQWRTVTKLVLYALRDATDQLRSIRLISVVITSREQTDDLYIVTAKATTIDGRTDESIGVVPIAGLKGEALANALMKGETKAKRRVTLSISGLGWLDETEVTSIPGSETVVVDVATGELPPTASSLLQPRSAAAQVATTPPKGPYTEEQLRAAVAASSMSWDQFEIQVLGTSWDTWIKRHGTPSAALTRWEGWQLNQKAKEA